MSKSKKLGLGLLIGAAAGIVTGFLTAPKSGKETRGDLKKKADDVKQSAERKLKEAYKELGKLSDETKVAATKLTGKAKVELDELGKKAEALKQDVKEAITSIKSGDDDKDDATIDQILKDIVAVKSKIGKKIKDIKA